MWALIYPEKNVNENVIPVMDIFRILEVNDGKGGKAIEENPFLKIWATKLSAFRVTEFGNLEDVRKKTKKLIQYILLHVNHCQKIHLF